MASNKAASTSQTPKPYNNYADNISRPFLKTDSIPKKNEESFLEASSNVNSHFLKIISYQLQNLDTSLKGKAVSCLDKTCQNQELETSSHNEEENHSHSSEDIHNVIEETFGDSSRLTINKIKNWNQGGTWNYYPRPTPPDL